MRKYVLWLKKSKNVRKDDYIWNMIASTMNSVQTVILLLVVTRGTNGVNDSSAFVIAYAIANLLMTIGKYGMRNFQVTDVNGQFSFRTYELSRRISVLLMIGMGGGYVLYAYMFKRYTINKCIVVLTIIFLRVFDSYEDVYHGVLQREGKLYVASRIVAIRLGIYYIFFIVMFLITDDLANSLLGSVTISCLCGFILNKVILQECSMKKEMSKKNELIKLMKICFPLCICSFLLTYFSNAPKYIADSYLSEVEQAMFNYIFMPVFVICLLGNYIFLPLLARVAVLWNEGEYGKFLLKLISQIGMLFGITFVLVIVSYFMGIPALEVIFNAELEAYKTEFLLLILSGGLLAIVYLMNMFMTIVRCQKSMLICFAIASVITAVSEGYYAQKAGMLGISVTYCIVLLLLSIVLLVILLNKIRIRGERK